MEQRLRRDTSFERLYRRHRRDVYGAVLRDVRDPDEAEDVTQIAFLNAFHAIRRGERPDKPRAWLVTIARNVIRRRYRQLARRPQEVALDPEVAADLAEGPTAGEIAAAIRRLPANQRAVILLREIQGRSYADIAAELDLSLAAVETLIFRARRSLSQELELADHVPATQGRRAHGLFLLPLPGLGKLASLGFSLSRAGVAAVAGGVAIVATPVGDRAPEPGRASTVRQAPAFVRTGHPGGSPLTASRSARSGSRSSADAAGKPRSATRAGAPARRPRGEMTPGVELPKADLPGSDLVTLPGLPVEPPDLPSPPPPPPPPALPPPPPPPPLLG